MWRLRLAMGIVALITGALAGYAGAGSRLERTDSGRCLKVSKGLVSSLKGGLKRAARGKLGTPRGVKSRGEFGGPNSFANGVYFVSARVRGFGIATWATDRDAFRTGGGFIVDVGPVARRVSVAGIDIPLSTLRGWGLTSAADGYAASRNCVRA